MFKRCLVFLLAAAVATGAFAQGKKRIERAADLPRFTYKVEGKLEDLVRNAESFGRFAAQVRRTTSPCSTATTSPTSPRSATSWACSRSIDFLEGRYADAARRADEIRPSRRSPPTSCSPACCCATMVAAQAKVGSIDFGGLQAGGGPDRRREAREAALRGDRQRHQGGEDRLPRSSARPWCWATSATACSPSWTRRGACSARSSRPRSSARAMPSSRGSRSRRRSRETYTAYLAANKVEKPRHLGRARRGRLPTGKRLHAGERRRLGQRRGRFALPRPPGARRGGQARLPRVRRPREPLAEPAHAHPGRAARQAAAAQVAHQGPVGPAVERRQPRGERGEGAALEVEARRVPRRGRGDRPRQQLQPRHARGRHRHARATRTRAS